MGFEVLSADSFTSVWYWLILAVAWSAATQWTLGVPHDVLSRADRDPQAAEMTDTWAWLSVRRLLGGFRRSGGLMAGSAAFFFTVLAVLGWGYGIEFFEAAFLLLAPLFGIQLLAIRLALRVEARGLRGAALRRALKRRRFFDQVLGLVVLVGIGAATIRHLASSFPQPF